MVQRAPHPTARKHPQRNAQKATLTERGCKEKGPANSSRESRRHHRKIVRKGPKGNPKSNQASITRQYTPIKGNYSGDDDCSKSKTPKPPPTHNGPTVKPQHETKTHKAPTPNPQNNPKTPTEGTPTLRHRTLQTAQTLSRGQYKLIYWWPTGYRGTPKIFRYTGKIL